MSTTPSPDRRFTLALTAAVAATTLAVGVTTGALFGWIGPRDRSTEPAPPSASAGAGARVVYVPITPTAPPPVSDSPTASEPRVALAEPRGEHDDHRGDDHRGDDHRGDDHRGDDHREDDDD